MSWFYFRSQVIWPLLAKEISLALTRKTKMIFSRTMQLHSTGLLNAFLLLFLAGCHAKTQTELSLLDRYGSQGSKVLMILSKSSVASDLKLSADQLRNIENIRTMDARSIPLVQDLLKLPNAPTNFQQRFEHATEIRRLTEMHQLTRCYSILSIQQSHRLGELLCQVVGVKTALSNPVVANKLKLTDSQLQSMQEVVERFEKTLNPVYRTFGRQKVAGLSPSETLESRSLEVENLVRTICKTERTRDTALLDILSPEQMKVWKTMKGVPLRIEWSVDDYMDFFSTQ